MKSLSDSIRQQIRKRANNRCEYCLSHQDYTMGWLQIDHIQPVARGGLNTMDNLCLACELCNQYKWTQTEALDPESDEMSPLFNPRQHQWQQHFTWSADGTQILGTTSIGRATVIALKLNNTLAVTVRKNWVIAGWHPPDNQ